MSKHYTLKKVALLFASHLLSMSLLLAVPAKKGIQVIVQPDGKKLTITLQGDENFHYRTTTDGYAVVENEKGFHVFAQVNTEGVFVPSSIIASNPEERTDSEINALRTLPTNKSENSRSRVRQYVESKVKRTVSTPTKATGTHGKCIVILAQFNDKSFTIPDTKQSFTDMLNKPGYTNSYGQNGSAYDYFRDNSMNQFSPEFNVIGPVTLPQPMAYYGANDTQGYDLRPAHMVVDAINQAKAELEKLTITDYDNNNDGEMDNIFIFFAGNNEAEGAPSTTIWPHAWNIQSANLSLPTINGIKINTYACSSELRSTGTKMAGIGTFVHEFGHILGIADMYDTDYDGSGGNSFALDCWSVMSSGSYNGEGCIPAGYTAYERMFCGWLTPKELTTPVVGELKSLQGSNEAYIIKTYKNSEYFLLENRQLEKWDSKLPKSGMLIYHIDYNELIWRSNRVNANPGHQYVDLEAADYSKDTYNPQNPSVYQKSLLGDPYPGSMNKTEFTDSSQPSSVLWNATSLNKPVTKIKEVDKVISFSFMGGSNMIAPQNIQSTEIKDTEFSLSWDAAAAAEKYLLDVYTYDSLKENRATEIYGFNNPMIPVGFNSSTLSTYSTIGNYGQSAPSLKFDRSGAFLETKVFSMPITEFTFWVKGQSLTDSKLKIEGYNGTVWSTIDEFVPANIESIKTYGTTLIPTNTFALRFSYTKVTGNMAFDDLMVTTSSFTPVKKYLNGYYQKDLGNVLSTKVTGLIENKEYWVQMNSVNSDDISVSSSELKIKTTTKTGSERVESSVKVYATREGTIVIDNKGTEVRTEIYNTSGSIIWSKNTGTGKHAFRPGQKGVYIIRCGASSCKVVL
ncbi:MAG: M6 family metalloprotease domain-containing protein [Bacteroidales bacterium]